MAQQNNIIQETTDNVTTPLQFDLFKTQATPIVTNEELKKIQDANEQARIELEEKYTYSDIAENATSLEWISSSILRQTGREKLAPDPNYEPTEELFLEVAKSNGIRPDYIDSFAEAQSEEHLYQIASEIKSMQEKEEIIMSKGVGKGITARILAMVLDPVAIGATIATEGALAPLIFANKLTRAQRFIRGGLAGASTNAAIDGYLMSQNPTMDLDDVLFSALIGFGVGGAIAAVPRTNLENKAFYDAVKNDAIKTDIKNQKLELTPKGENQLGGDPNYKFNSTRITEDAETPLETIDGIKRSDGRYETKIKEGQEYMRQINPDGTHTLRRCT